MKEIHHHEHNEIVAAIASLDSDRIEAILKCSIHIEAFPRSMFIGKMKSVFKEFEAAGTTSLAAYAGECNGCSKGCTGFTFVNEIGDYMDIILLLKDGLVEDIFKCSELINKTEIEAKSRNVLKDKTSWRLVMAAPF